MTAATVDVVKGRTTGRTLRGFPGLAAAVADAPGDPAWLAELRHAGAARFNDVGLPGSRDEEWRFTPLQGLASIEFESPTSPSAIAIDDLEPFLLAAPEWPLLVVVDGQADPRLSRVGALPAVATFGSLSDAIAVGHPLVEQHLARHTSIEASALAAVNMALLRDGAFIHVGAGTTLRHPLHVLHIATDGAAGSIVAPRTLVVLDPGANATIVETFASVRHAGVTAQPYLDTACAEIVIGEGARLEHIRVQREDRAAYHVGFTTVDQDRDSHYRSFVLALGAKLSRHNLHARLGASNIETLLYGLYLARGEQTVDNHTAIYHDHPHCKSWEVYKGVLAERAHGVFNGKVIVQPEAQKTDAKQTNRNLLLGDEAKVDTKPQLEIFADDVKCTHGATVGKLDEQQRYYLRTRGIAGRTAEVLLITAFMAEVLAEIVHPQVREALQALVYAEMDAVIG